MKFFLLAMSLCLATPALAADTADEVLIEAYQHDRPRSIVWYGGWIVIQSALTAGSLGLALERGPLFASERGSEDWNYQGQMIVGAATSALGLASIAIGPPATLRPLPGESGELRRRMSIAAKQERGTRNWFGHFSNVVVNGVAATLVGTLFESPHDAVITFLVGVAVGEAQIFTRPMAAQKAWKNANGRFPAQFAVVPYGPGAMIAGRW